MTDTERVVDADEVPSESTLLITVEEELTGDEKEAILIQTNGDIACWLNYCQHWTDVRLDRGDGALVRGTDIVCQKHGATFQKDSGFCDFGPCEGSVLPEIDVEVSDGDVVLTDSDYSFIRVGESEDTDLSSGSRIDF